MHYLPLYEMERAAFTGRMVFSYPIEEFAEIERLAAARDEENAQTAKMMFCW